MGSLVDVSHSTNMKIVQLYSVQRRKKNEENEQSLGDLWETIICTNTHILAVPEKGEREKGQIE